MATFTRANFVQPQSLTTIDRDALTLGIDDTGLTIWNVSVDLLQVWDGSAWRDTSQLPLDASQLIGEISGGIY